MARLTLLRRGVKVIESENLDDFGVAVASIASAIENPAELLAALLLLAALIEAGVESYSCRIGSVELSVDRVGGNGS